MATDRCMICKKRAAVVKLVRVAKNRKREYWLCRECAEHYTITPPPSLSVEPKDKFSQLFMGILGVSPTEQENKEDEKTQVDLTCPNCGRTFRAYREKLLLGCSECYKTFEEQLIVDLRKYHGDTYHRGRKQQVRTVPEYVMEETFSIEELERKLAQAVANEDFELAAKLRDEIRARKSQHR